MPQCLLKANSPKLPVQVRENPIVPNLSQMTFDQDLTKIGEITAQIIKTSASQSQQGLQGFRSRQSSNKQMQVKVYLPWHNLAQIWHSESVPNGVNAGKQG